MAGYRLPSSERFSVGRVVVSVALDPPAASMEATQYRGLARLTEQLVDRLNKARLPATWGVVDPVHAAATSLILPSGIEAGIEHELAILGDTTWIGPQAGRPRLAKELNRRMMQARTKGIELSTLLIRDADPKQHLDLFVKQGITSICQIPDAPTKVPHCRQPRTLRYGLWEISVSAKLPLASGWFLGRRLNKHIERTARESNQMHLLIDAPGICQQGTRAENAVKRVIQTLGQLRDRGLIVAETLGTAAARMSDQPASKPQRSILRLAA